MAPKSKTTRRRHNGGHPASRADAGEATPEIVEGGTYRLRNGSIVSVTRNPATGDWAKNSPWRGQFIGHIGEPMHWRSDGAYGANWVGHELDIMEAVSVP